MTNKQKVMKFRRIVNEMADLYEKKNSNYGDSFGQLYKKLGPIAGLVPLHNKLDRATNLIKGGKNDFESLEDTFKDLACYAIMNLIELNNQNVTITDIISTTEPNLLKEYVENYDKIITQDNYLSDKITTITPNVWNDAIKPYVWNDAIYRGIFPKDEIKGEKQ